MFASLWLVVTALAGSPEEESVDACVSSNTVPRDAPNRLPYDWNGLPQYRDPEHPPVAGAVPCVTIVTRYAPRVAPARVRCEGDAAVAAASESAVIAASAAWPSPVGEVESVVAWVVDGGVVAVSPPPTLHWAELPVRARPEEPIAPRARCGVRLVVDGDGVPVLAAGKFPCPPGVREIAAERALAWRFGPRASCIPKGTVQVDVSVDLGRDELLARGVPEDDLALVFEATRPPQVKPAAGEVK